MTTQDLLDQADIYKNKLKNTNYGKAHSYMLQSVQEARLSITEDFIRELHSLLCPEPGSATGQYRNFSIADTKEGYHFPAPEDIPQLMHHLSDQLSSSQSVLHPIELAAMCLKRLLDIQPFSSDNGAVAGLVMNRILLSFGYEAILIPFHQSGEFEHTLALSRSTKVTAPLTHLVARWVYSAEKSKYHMTEL